MKARSNAHVELNVCPTYGNWVTIFDSDYNIGKWHVNVSISEARYYRDDSCYECKVSAVEPGVWKITYDTLWVELDCRVSFEEFREHLKNHPNLAAIARMLYALRPSSTEISAQLTPMNGDYANVLEAIKYHLEWSRNQNWIDELAPQ